MLSKSCTTLSGHRPYPYQRSKNHLDVKRWELAPCVRHEAGWWHKIHEDPSAPAHKATGPLKTSKSQWNLLGLRDTSRTQRFLERFLVQGKYSRKQLMWKLWVCSPWNKKKCCYLFWKRLQFHTLVLQYVVITTRLSSLRSKNCFIPSFLQSMSSRNFLKSHKKNPVFLNILFALKSRVYTVW